MKLQALALPVCGLALSLCCAAQSTSTWSSSSDDKDAPRRSFLVSKDAKVLNRSGEWRGIERLASYAKAHPGTYILFVQDGALHRLDSVARVAEAEKLYEPSRTLAAQQAALAAQQRPLGEQQAALGEQQGALGRQMRSAGSPGDMSSIGRTQGTLGHEQGIVGRAQGTIGREQGVIGRQQGIEGRHFYEQMQTMLDGCLKDGTCPVVNETGA